MKYSSLGTDIMEIIKDKMNQEDSNNSKKRNKSKATTTTIVKEAIDIISWVDLFHFNALRVVGSEEMENSILINLRNDYLTYILEISKDGKLFDMKENDNNFYFHFSLKKANIDNQPNISLSYEYYNDIIRINGNYYEYIVSYYENIPKILSKDMVESQLQGFQSDKEDRKVYATAVPSKYTSQRQINEALDMADEMKKRLEKSKYRKFPR